MRLLFVISSHCRSFFYWWSDAAQMQVSIDPAQHLKSPACSSWPKSSQAFAFKTPFLASRDPRIGQSCVAIHQLNSFVIFLSPARVLAFSIPFATMSSQQWVWDSVPHYRLDQSIIDKYLREKFGNYTTFHTEVNAPGEFEKFAT